MRRMAADRAVSGNVGGNAKPRHGDDGVSLQGVAEWLAILRRALTGLSYGSSYAVAVDRLADIRPRSR